MIVTMSHYFKLSNTGELSILTQYRFSDRRTRRVYELLSCSNVQNRTNVNGKAATRQ